MDKNNIIHISKLANLKVSEKEINKYYKQLDETLKYIENLNLLDTQKITPTHHVTNINNVYFKDGKKNDRQLTKENMSISTKIAKNNYFITKKILEK